MLKDFRLINGFEYKDSDKMKPAHVAPLPVVEISIYFVFWIGGLFYSTYHVYNISISFEKQMDVEELEPGWNIIGRKKDVSDYEWRMWMPFLWELAPWFLLHHIGAELLRWFGSKELLRLWYVLVTCLFSAYYCGCVSLIAMISVPTILFIISQVRKPIFCWAASILLLVSLSTFHIQMLSEQQLMALYVSFAWIQLRCMSFCLDWIYSKPWAVTCEMEIDCSPQILRLFSYTFYLPLMFLGPFVSFQDFENAIRADLSSWGSLRSRTLKLVLNTCRFLVWMAVTEFCLHFIYCNAIQLHHEALPFLDAWTLNGLAYCIGQFFLNKYVVVYGLMGTLAGFDAIHSPPVPRCIAHISMYSDMWRHFDRGFYNFLRSYIYDPLTEMYGEKKRHVFLSSVCFAFVYVWHGLSMNILMWSVCNFIGITVETICHNVIKFDVYMQFEKRLSPQNVRRWRALAASPLFIMSALTMFYFFGGNEVGNVFVLQISHGSLLRNVALLFFAYCMCQVSLEIKIFKARRKEKGI